MPPVTAVPGSRSRVWVWSFAAAIALTALGTTQTYASRVIEGIPANLPTIFLREVVNWFSWALLAPLVSLTAARVRFERSAPSKAIATWLGAALLLVFAHAMLEVATARLLELVPTPMPFATMLFARFSATLVANGVIFALIAVAFRAERYFRESRARELREAELHAELAESQLTVLRMQLQPHFLFNTLHAVSAMMTDDVEGARRVLAELGDFLRAGLTHARAQTVRLEEELALLHRYLDIQRVRFGDRLLVDSEVDPATLGALVPSLLLQPLVENALRHAIEPRAARGRVRISSSRRGDVLCLEIGDDGPGLSASKHGTAGTGVGLSNTRARLARLYGAKHQFELAGGPGRGLTVRITIPFQEAGRDGRMPAAG